MRSHIPGGPPPLPAEKGQKLRVEAEELKRRRRALCGQAEEAMSTVVAALEELATVDADHRHKLKALKQAPEPEGTQRAVQSWGISRLSAFFPPQVRQRDPYDGASLAERDPLTPNG